MSSTVIALGGLCGTGKSEATLFLAERLGAERVHLGGLVTERIHARGWQVNRETEQRMSQEIRAEGGMAAVAKLALPRILAALEAGSNVVLDGLYSLAEYEVLREALPRPPVLIALHSPRRVRYERLASRPERALRPDQVDLRDWSEVRNLDKAGPIALADHHVLNDGGMERLRAQLETIARSLDST